MTFATDISRSFGHQYSYPEPYDVSPRLAPRLAELGLGDHAEQLKAEGYTIVPDALDDELCSRLREAILRIARAEKGNYFDIKSGEGYSCYHLLGKDPAIAEALLNPQLLALAEYLCGEDFLLSQISGSVRFQGASAMPLHVDAQWYTPTPYNPMFTACVALEDLTEASGTTRVVPGSHLELRNPDDEEAAHSPYLPMEMMKGALGFWSGFCWHGNCTRQEPGERVMLHLTFCRLSYKPCEDYSDLGDDFLRSYPDVMATMLGRSSYLGHANRNGGECQMDCYPRMWEAARA